MTPLPIVRPQFSKQGQGLGKNSVADKGAPVSFGVQHDELTVAQKTAVLNTQALQAGYRTPYYIDEIRMTAFTGLTNSNGGSGVGYGLGVQFQTGHHAFSRNPIPMQMYAPVYLRAGYILHYFDGFFTTFRGVVEVRWPLPKPLYMEPGDVIQCFIDRSNQINISDTPYQHLGFNVTYVGRALPPGKPAPPCRYVPWVANYVHQTTPNSLYSSAAEAYRNPFTIPLHVHRLTQHTYASVEATPVNFFEYEGCRGPTDLGGLGESSYAQVRLYDSLGYAMVKEYAPIGEVMDMSRQAWTFSRPIGPREQFNADFQSTALSGAGITRYDTLLGMISHREEGF